MTKWLRPALAGTLLFASTGAWAETCTYVGSPGTNQTCVQNVIPTDTTGKPLGTSANPLVTSSSGGAASGGSVTSPGTSGTQAQAVQGATGGVPLPVSATALPLPAGAATAANQLVSPPPTVITITQSEVPVPAATSTAVLAANASRKFLSFTNDNLSPCRISYGVAATANNGEPLAAAAAVNGQGGARSYDAGVVTQQAIFAYCPSAGSLAVLEGQ